MLSLNEYRKMTDKNDSEEISGQNLTSIQCHKKIGNDKKYRTIIIIISIIFISILPIAFRFLGIFSLQRPIIFTGLKKYPKENVICFNKTNLKSYERYTSQLNNLIKLYERVHVKEGGKYIWCQDSNRTSDDQICAIDATWIQPCVMSNMWGYPNGEPCVILSYENDSNYNPISYDSIDQLPYNAPLQLKTIMEEEIEEDGEIYEKLVRLYCTHSNPANYHPRGFYDYFFPFRNINGYLPPIASIKFDLDFNNDIEYNIECSLWSKYPALYSVKNISFKIKHGNC